MHKQPLEMQYRVDSGDERPFIFRLAVEVTGGGELSVFSSFSHNLHFFHENLKVMLEEIRKWTVWTKWTI
jgi:hypothetical protein